MTLVDRDRLRSDCEELIEQMRSDPEIAARRVGVTARLMHDVTVESTFAQYDRMWTLTGDEAVSRGGHEEGPSPLRYSLSGIAICQDGYAKVGAIVGCEIEDLVLDVRTFMDMRGEHGFGDYATHPQFLLFDLQVKSPASSDAILQMVAWGDERCPLGILVRRAIPVYERVTHNGALIRDTFPPALA